MLKLLLILFGVHVDQAGRLAHWDVAPRGSIGIGWLVLAAIVLCSAVVWMYRRSARHLAPVRRWSLTLLRCGFLVLLLTVLARPVLRFTIEGSVRRSLLMLFDASKSMDIQDPRTDEADLKRAALARNLLDPAKGLDQPFDRARQDDVAHLTRLEVVKGAFRNERMNLLPRLAPAYDLKPFTFGKQVDDLASLDAGKTADDAKAIIEGSSLDWLDALKATADETRLGDAVRDLLARTRGQPVAGMVVVTDGQSNAGSSLVLAAEQAKREGVPLYVYGVGISNPKDVIVSNLFAPEVCFVNDEVTVSVRVRNTGLAGETAKLALTLNNDLVDAADVTFDAAGEQVVPVKFKPTRAGKFTLKARIEPRPDEAVKDNNEYAQDVTVNDAKIKVLYVEQSPRWEFKYLQQVLLRDPRIDAKFWLVEGDPSIAAGEKSPYLKGFPASAQDLFKYDLLILGDVDPRTFSAEQLDGMKRFVGEFGGGFVSLAGRRFNPGAYAGTPVGDLLVVDPEEDHGGRTGRAGDGAEAADQPIHLELTPAGRQSSMLRIDPLEAANAQRWAQLPPVWWDARVFRPKPAAEVLVVDPDRGKENRYGKMPVMALQGVGLGQSLYVGTDNLWRWRRNAGEKDYVALWGQIVYRLSLPHLLGANSKKTQITADQQTYTVGDKVTVLARLYDDAFKPLELPELKGFYATGVDQPTGFQLRPVGGQRGMYRGEFIAPAPGRFAFWVDRDDTVKRDFTVTAPKLELGETAMNEAALRDMATTSGGQFFREEDLLKLPDALRLQNERVQSTYEVELWSSWAFFLTLLAVVTAEWILRKLSQMK